MSNFAGADATIQSFAAAFPGSVISPRIGVLHTTEGRDFPDYADPDLGPGASAPHYTGRPRIAQKELAWRAHFPDERNSRALLRFRHPVTHALGVKTNTNDVINIELVGTCDPRNRVTWRKPPISTTKTAGVDYLFWPDAPDWALREVAVLVADLHARHGIPLTAATPWRPHPASFGTGASQRLTEAKWLPFRGWCGHQHVPTNDHGDPGDIDITTILQLASAHAVAPFAMIGDEFDMADINDLRKAIRDVVDTPAFKADVARFVLTGFAFAGADGVKRVLAGHVTTLETIAQEELARDAENLAQILGSGLTAQEIERALKTVISTRADRSGGTPGTPVDLAPAPPLVPDD